MGLTAKQARRGCALAVLGLALTVAFFAWRTCSRVSRFVAPEPQPLPQVAVVAAEAAAVRQRIDTVADRVAAGRPVEASFTAHEINQAIATDPRLAGLHGRVFVKEIAGGIIRVQTAMPLRDLGLDTPSLADRYFSGTLHLELRTDVTGPVLRVVHLEQDGEPAPGVILDQLRQRNLYQDIAAKYPEIREVGARVRELGLADGMLHLELGGK